MGGGYLVLFRWRAAKDEQGQVIAGRTGTGEIENGTQHGKESHVGVEAVCLLGRSGKAADLEFLVGSVAALRDTIGISHEHIAWA
jgi:hypothetical protein